MVVGVSGLVCGLFATITRDSFWRGLWLNLATAMVLFVALYLVQTRVLDRKVIALQDQFAEELTDVALAVRREVAASLADVRREFDARMASAAERDALLVSQARAGASRDLIGDLLARAEELHAVASSGPRVAVPGQYERLVFAPPSAEGDIVVTLVTWVGDRLGERRWVGGQPAADFFAQLAELLQQHGRFETGGAFDPERILDQLITTLDVAIASRTRRGGGPADLGRVIEVPVAGWAITEDGIEAVGQHQYVVERARVHEKDWYQHMKGKSWVVLDDFDYALEIARALFPPVKASG